MKKVLHIQLLPLISGVQRFSLYLLDGLDRTEFEPWLACKPGGELVEQAKSCGYGYIPLPSFRHAISPYDLITFLHLIFVIHKHRFDIVHTHSSKPGLLGRLAARICGVKYILHTSHGTAFQDNQSRMVYWFYVAMEWLGNTLGHHTVFVNNSDRMKCLKMKLISEVKASTIYNAIPPAQSSALAALAEERNLSPAEIVIGSTIRFSTQKNAISLVTAACKACEKVKELKFIFVGDGEHYRICQAVVQSKHLGNRILMPGWDSGIVKWLKRFNCFVLYSRWEAQPFSIIEAMNSGLAVIGSAIPSILELVDDSTGYLVPLDAEAALVETFIDVATDFPTAYNKGQCALGRIMDLCNYDKMVSGYLKLYRGF